MALLPNTIDNLKAMIETRGGLAKADRFMVFMTPPSYAAINTDVQGLLSAGLSGNLSLKTLVNDPRDIALLCDTCALPGRVIETIEMPYQGYRQNIKVPAGYINDEVTMTFHVTNDFYAKKLFGQWMDLTIDQSAYIAKYRSDYGSDIIIQHINEANVPTFGVKLIDAYPTNIQTITLGNDQSDTTVKVEVTFAFTDFVDQGALSSIRDGIGTTIEGFKL